MSTRAYEPQGGGKDGAVDPLKRLVDEHRGAPRQTPSLSIKRAEGAETITVRLPAELPTLTVGAARILLAILVELTRIEILDVPAPDASEEFRDTFRDERATVPGVTKCVTDSGVTT